jgi:dienelactone hydrolase
LDGGIGSKVRIVPGLGTFVNRIWRWADRFRKDSAMTRPFMILVAIAAIAMPFASACPQGQTFALRPASPNVTVTKDVEYGRSDTVALRMDVYRSVGSSGTSPTLIFYNHATGADRRWFFYDAWARAAASRGLVAIVFDLRFGSEASDFQALMGYLTSRGATVGVNKDAIALYAGSGNVFSAFPLVEDPKLTTVKAAVMYYGEAPITEFRRDLPVLYVRAGLDRPSVNEAIVKLAALAVAQNAPVTLVNHASGYHGFEMFNDDDATREVMEQTIAFVRRATSPAFQAAIHRGVPEATAAGHVQVRDFAKAVPIYADLVAARPDDSRLRLSYGEALLGNAQYAEACGELEKLKGKGLGPRDLGLPAARACMLKGDADAAMGWLKTIPTRFLPPDVQSDTVFAPLKWREDFRALFASRKGAN